MIQILQLTEFILKKADQILAEINRIGDQTRWNGMNFDGTFDDVQLQVGHKKLKISI